MKNTQLRNLNKVLHNGGVKTIDGVVRGHVCFVEDVTHQFEKYVYGPWVDLDEVEFVSLTEEILLKCGAYQLPHFTLMNSFYFDLGRNRELSLGSVGTPNLFVCIQEIEKDENGKPIKVEDIICVHNFDYDGQMYLHQLQNLIFVLTGQELNVKL